MNYIDLDKPDSLEKLEKAGAFYKAAYELAEAYGLEKPATFLSIIKGSAWYELSSLLNKQQPDKNEDGDKKDTSTEDDDKPINLDDIPF